LSATTAATGAGVLAVRPAASAHWRNEVLIAGPLSTVTAVTLVAPSTGSRSCNPGHLQNHLTVRARPRARASTTRSVRIGSDGDWVAEPGAGLFDELIDI
jgi:hypothetical protein